MGLDENAIWRQIISLTVQCPKIFYTGIKKDLLKCWILKGLKRNFLNKEIGLCRGRY